MKRRLIPLIPISAAILSSCSPVTTQIPVSNETEISLQDNFAGSWRIDDGVVHVAFDETGFGQFAATYWEENEFKTTRGKFNALATKDEGKKGLISIQVEEEEEDEDKTYLFCAFKLADDDEQILIWETDSISEFKPFLEADKMAGQIQHQRFGEDTILFVDGAELASRINEFGTYFDLEDPIILTRVVPKEIPESAAEEAVEN